jgi:hypothetical protein
MDLLLFSLAIIGVGAVIEHQRSAIDRLQRMHADDSERNRGRLRRR